MPPTHFISTCALACLWLPSVAGESYDFTEPFKLPPQRCANGCALWVDLAKDGNPANQTEVDALWRERANQVAASRSCAQPALSPASTANAIGGYSGTYCFCKGPLSINDAQIGYCRSAPLVPEQINLQVGGTDVLIASFVTFGDLPHGSKPIAQLSTRKDMSDARNFTGITNTYLSPDFDTEAQPVRSYNMHFVALSGLAERTQYFYRVAAFAHDQTVLNATECPGWTCTIENQYCPPGAPHATPPSGDRCCSGKWIPGAAPCKGAISQVSDVISFRSLYSKGATRLGIFGDMGVMNDGNTIHGGMLRDALAGEIDFFVHMGDHAYQMSSDDDRRGDGYMNAYMPLISQVPWVPVVGNHEAYDNSHFRRFLNQSFGMHMCNGTEKAHFCSRRGGCASSDELRARHPKVNDGDCISADTALGTLLVQSHAQGSAVSSPVPSNTSRWYSKNIGLVHLIALDIMVYPGFEDSDTGPTGFEAAQRAWLELDLAAVDRAETPWVIVTAHHPLYCSSVSMGIGTTEGAMNTSDNGGPSTATLNSKQRQMLPKDKDFRGCLGTGEDNIARARASLEPLFLKYGVDMYLAGHEHNYESIYPVKHCAMESGDCYIGEDFNRPQAPVHVVCGNGGVNGGDAFGSNWGPWTRKQLGVDTPGECNTLISGRPTEQGGCSAGYGRIEAHNSTHLTYSYVLNVNSTVWDSWTIYQPNHGAFSDIEEELQI